MVFVTKKQIKGRDYYYVVKSTRVAENKWKKIQRYVGINPPTKKDLQKYEQEFDFVKNFISEKQEILGTIKEAYAKKLKHSTKDELAGFEEDVLIRFTYETSRIEGSTLSYKDTKMLLQEGISPREKPIRDIKETENHKQAFLYMKSYLNNEIDKEFILKLHQMLKKDVTEDAGSFRDANVSVGDLICLSPDMIETELENLLEWYKENKDEMHPLELAAIFHSIFERIHPFFDGNGRVGRLLLNFILLKKGYPIVIIKNKNKRRYYTALNRADDGDYKNMIKYLFDELEKQAGEYLDIK